MRATSSVIGYLLTTFFVVAFGAITVGCGGAPTRPTVEQSAQPLATADNPARTTSTEKQPTVDLGRCLQRSSDASCFGDDAGSSAIRSSAPAVNMTLTVTQSPASVWPHAVTLFWTAPTTGSVARYQVIARGAGGTLADFSVDASTTSYHATPVFLGTYDVYIWAIDAGNTLVGESNVVPIVVSGVECFNHSDTPHNLRAVSNGPGMVELSWSYFPGDDSRTRHFVEAGSAPGLSDLARVDTGSRETSYSASGVAAGTYYLRVRSGDDCGYVSTPSNEVLFTLGGGPAGCAGPPASLNVVSQSAGTISLSWAAPASGSPTSYVIQAGTSPGSSNLADFDTGTTATTYTVSGVAAGSYFVRVLSKSGCGSSAASNEVLVYVVGFTGEVQISVSWDSPSDVDLHVIDPSGEEIYYANSTSRSGGQLDVDSNSACTIDGRQIENIRWPATGAPAGTYIVRVDYWSDCGVARTNYTVTVKNGGTTQTFTGSFTGAGDRGSYGSGREIATFTHLAGPAIGTAMESTRPPALVVPSPKKMNAR